MSTPNQQPGDEELIEQLAAIEHERWADWQKWCHQVIRENDQKGLSVEDVLENWDRQIATPYAELSEKEKQSDRDQVMRYWPLIKHRGTEIRIEELENADQSIFDNSEQRQAFPRWIEFYKGRMAHLTPKELTDEGGRDEA